MSALLLAFLLGAMAGTLLGCLFNNLRSSALDQRLQELERVNERNEKTLEALQVGQAASSP